jgi:alpha-beta hydrolase superfamily lysophospholipase
VLPAAAGVLLVHGLRATREEGLRVVSTLNTLGYPVLLLSYRNDPDAAASPDGYYHLGDTEWRDPEAAVREAIGRGARDVVLYGWSMGGSIIETFQRRSTDKASVRAVILDAPMLDWLKSIDAQVRRMHLPGWFTHVLAWFAARKAKLRFSDLRYVHPSTNRSVATLVFHGSNDSLVPIDCSDQFARSLPDLIAYHRVDGAEHTESWNSDPARYESVLRNFLQRVAEPPVPARNRRPHLTGPARQCPAWQPRATDDGIAEDLFEHKRRPSHVCRAVETTRSTSRA